MKALAAADNGIPFYVALPQTTIDWSIDSGDDIPIEARICSVVDYYDALTMDRPYREALNSDEVVEMIVADSGSAFDPYVVDVFVKARYDIEEIQAEYVDEPTA